MYFPNQGKKKKHPFTLGDKYFKPFVEHGGLIPRFLLCHDPHTKKDFQSPVIPISCLTSLRTPGKYFSSHLGHKVLYSSHPRSGHL